MSFLLGSIALVVFWMTSSVGIRADWLQWGRPDRSNVSAETGLFKAISTSEDCERRERKAPDAVYVPSPPDVVKKMLELAGLKKGDLVYDLGSGDGRIVIAAAKDYGCKAVGVELDKDLVKKSVGLARKAGVEKLVTFENANLFEADFTKADVVALYLLPTMNAKLIPALNKLKPGSRIVAHCFPIPGMRPEKTIKLTSTEDDVERPVFLYTIPLKTEK